MKEVYSLDYSPSLQGIMDAISRGDCLLMGFRSAPAPFGGSLSTSEELGCPATGTLPRSPCVLTARQPKEAAAHR